MMLVVKDAKPFPKAAMNVVRKPFNNGEPLLNYSKLFNGTSWRLGKKEHLANKPLRHVVVTIWRASKRQRVKIQTRVIDNDLYVAALPQRRRKIA